MSTKIYVGLKDDDDPMILLGMQLEQLMPGIKMGQGVVFEVESDEVADAMKRILTAAERDFRVIDRAKGGATGSGEYVSPGNLFIVGHAPDVISPALTETMRISEDRVMIHNPVTGNGFFVDGPVEQESAQSDAPEETRKDKTGEAITAVEDTIAVVTPEFHQSEQVDGQGILPVATITDEHPIEKPCDACGKMFVPEGKGKRADLHKFCKDPECKKERNRRYANERNRRQRAIPDDNFQAESGPSNADLHEAEAFELALAEETDQDVVEIPEPKDEVEASADFRERVWYVEDGKLGGTKLTAQQLRWNLQNGRLHSGQHVRHQRDGRHEVVNIPGKPGQKLRKLFGEDAGQLVSA